MKILFVSSLNGDQFTGPTTSVPNQIKAQSMIDDVVWINYSKSSLQDSQTDKKFFQVFSFKQFKNVIRSLGKIDFVVIEEFFKIKYAKLGSFLKKENFPYIIIPRCQIADRYLKHKFFKKKMFYLLFLKKLFLNASAVQFLTDEEYNESKGLAKNTKYFIVPNGIHLSGIQECDFRNEIKPKYEGVFIGRLAIDQKGLDILIEAIDLNRDLLLKRNIVFSLYGPNEKSGNQNSIQKIIDDNQLSHLIKVKDSVYGDEKNKVLSQADFFVCTSRYEGLPMSVLEALSYGVPILATKGSNMADVIKVYNAGWTADTNSQSVSTALHQLCNYDFGTNPYRINALALSKIYSWDAIAKRSHDEYEKLIYRP